MKKHGRIRISWRIVYSLAGLLIGCVFICKGLKVQALDKRLFYGLVGGIGLGAFAPSYFIGLLLGPFMKDLEEKEMLARSGFYIGIAERSLMVMLIFVEAYTAVGIILATKLAVRSPEFKEKPRFGEYYLIGTFISIGWAIFVGISLRLLFGLNFS